MKLELKDIQKKLSEGFYKNEEHIRFSIITRLLSCLGWNIWNPDEVYFEYPVKKFPFKDKTVEEKGKVDIALFLSNRKDRTPEVFIETKSVGKLINAKYSDYEEQLQRYNFYDKSAISLLSDGIIWKFYLPSAGGTFSQRLFSEINILEDSEQFIISVLNKVLLKDNFRKNAVLAGEFMLEEQKIIAEIVPIKEKAKQLAGTLGDSKYDIAQKILRNNYKKEISIEDIKKYWNYKFCNNVYNTNLNKHLQGNENNEIVDLLNFDPKGKKPKKVFIIDKWYDVNSWAEIYKLVAKILITKFPDTDLCGFLQNENKWKKGINVVKLENGKYLYCNWDSRNCLRYSKQFLELFNYDIKTNFKLIL